MGITQLRVVNLIELAQSLLLACFEGFMHKLKLVGKTNEKVTEKPMNETDGRSKRKCWTSEKCNVFNEEQDKK